MKTGEPRRTAFPGGLEGGSFKPLSGADIEKIHQATLEVLGGVGFEVHNDEALDLFKKSGAEIEEERRLVKVSSGMVGELVDRAPHSLVLCGRDERHDLDLGGGRVYLGTGGTALNILDARAGECRRANLGDLIEIIKLVDKLDHIHFIVLPTYPDDLPQEKVDVNRFFAGLNHTKKHVMGGVYTSRGIERVIQMAEMVAGSREALRERPFISMITCGISPLRLDSKYGGFMIKVAREGIPVAVPAEPLCGATSPVTLAGNLVIQNCDALINVMTTQLANPGAPVIYGCVATSTDLRDLKYLGGSVESGLINAATSQMAQFYSLPYYATAGISDSKCIDAQCGYESALNNLMVALSGANFIHDAAGLMEFAMTVCKEKYVVDNEIGMVMRAVSGIEVNDQTLALDTIREIGPGGHFVAARHTRKFMKKEHYRPTLSDRDQRKDWELNGSLDTLRRATAVVEEILGEDEPSMLEDSLRGWILGEFGEIASEHYL